MNSIEVNNLSRFFNGLKAVDNISFTVGEGRVFGLLGPNGAGKTTTIRMLTGQLRPSSGRAQILGFDVVRERGRLKPKVGVVFEYQNIYERMSGRDNLLFSARLYNVDNHRVDEALDRVGLRFRADDPVNQYSNGMKQRLLIARALLHQPQVLFFDEPTKGLDPAVAREIRKLVKDLADQRVTILLTTHYMEEADQLCHKVAILNEGSVVALDSPRRLKVAHGQRMLKVELKDGQRITLSLDDRDDGLMLGNLASSGQILTLHSAEATLEEVFVKLTGKELLR